MSWFFEMFWFLKSRKNVFVGQQKTQLLGMAGISSSTWLDGQVLRRAQASMSSQQLSQEQLVHMRCVVRTVGSSFPCGTVGQGSGIAAAMTQVTAVPWIWSLARELPYTVGAPPPPKKREEFKLKRENKKTSQIRQILFTKQISDKVLVTRRYKELIKLNIKKTDNPIKHWQSSEETSYQRNTGGK